MEMLSSIFINFCMGICIIPGDNAYTSSYTTNSINTEYYNRSIIHEKKETKEIHITKVNTQCEVKRKKLLYRKFKIKIFKEEKTTFKKSISTCFKEFEEKFDQAPDHIQKQVLEKLCALTKKISSKDGMNLDDVD